MITQKTEQHPKGGLCSKHTGDLTAPGAPASEVGQWLFVAASDTGVDLVVTAGSAKVEMTSGLPSECQSGTATAFDWDQGTQTGAGAKTTIINGATAIRLNLLGASTVAALYVRSVQ
jgi:hypothetical protein